LRVRELIAPGTSAGGMVQDRLDASAVLASQPLDHDEALFDPVEPRPLAVELLRLQALRVVAKLAGQLSGLDHERTQALAEAVEARIHAREGIQLRRGPGEPVGGTGRLRRLGGKRLHAGAGGRAQRARLAQPLARRYQLLVLAPLESGL